MCAAQWRGIKLSSPGLSRGRFSGLSESLVFPPGSPHGAGVHHPILWRLRKVTKLEEGQSDVELHMIS